MFNAHLFNKTNGTSEKRTNDRKVLNRMIDQICVYELKYLFMHHLRANFYRANVTISEEIGFSISLVHIQNTTYKRRVYAAFYIELCSYFITQSMCDSS